MVNHRGYTHSPPSSGRIKPDLDPNIPEESRCVKEDTRAPNGIDSTDPRDVVCLSGVFRVCEVADKKTIKHDKVRNINEYSRFTPDIPKINKHVRSFRAVCRCWPSLGLHCRCLRMFLGRVTLFTDVPSLFADVLTKPADLAIGDHRAPQSGQCKPRLSKPAKAR